MTSIKLLESSCNASDPDADVFENLTHLRGHRRGSGLRRIEKYLNLTSSSTEDKSAEHGDYPKSHMDFEHLSKADFTSSFALH